MNTEPTNEHREQAREIVEQFSLHKVQLIEPPTNRQYHFNAEELIDEIASALSSRDAEIREVLEDLRGHCGPSNCWCDAEADAPHLYCCTAAATLYAKLQPLPSENPGSTFQE